MSSALLLRAVRALGLVFALFAVSANAQVRPDSTRRPPPDSAALAAQDSVRKAVAKALADSIRNAAAQLRIDSIYRAKLADTIKSPFAQFERPDTPELTSRLRFSRAQILSSGAVNLVDLLDRVPGITSFRTGWLAGFHTASYNGDFKRIRVFFDGIERDAIEPRNGGVLDFNDVPLWALDEIVVERMASEVRVWLTSWTARRTTPVTRVDIFTGDLNTNGFRGLFARRFRNGLLFQLVGEQMATQTGRVSAFGGSTQQPTRGDGNGQFVDTRIGWARGKFTFDVAGSAVSRERDAKQARDGFTDLLAFKGSRREGYARAAYGDSLKGFWTQALVGVLRTRLEGVADTTTSAETDSTLVIDSDTVRARTQQMLVVGYRSRWWHASVLDRVRPIDGTSHHSPAARVGLGTDRVQLSGYAEKRPLDSLTQVEGSAVARPTSWVSLAATGSRRMTRGDSVRIASTSIRAEGALRYKRMWFGGGLIHAGVSDIAAPLLFGGPDVLVRTPAATGVLGNIRGQVYKDLHFDLQAVSWDAAQFARPKLNVRTELALVSNWPSKFPLGQFSINARVSHEVREPVSFVWAVNDALTQRTTEPSRVVIALLEIRIQSATIFYQYRNLTGQRYEQIPGINMPQLVQMYGMRWEFWN